METALIGRHPRLARATVLVVVAALFGVLIPAQAATAQTAPVIVRAEVRPNRTVLVEWLPVADTSEYEVLWRTTGAWTQLTTVSTDPDGTDPVTRVINPADWTSSLGQTYELAVRALADEAEPSEAVPVRYARTWPRPELATAEAAAVTVSWEPVAATDPFVGYELYLGRPGDWAANCLVGEVTSRTTNSIRLNALPATCGGGSLNSATHYVVGLRVVTNELPRSTGPLSITTVSTSGGPDPAERFATAQVDGRWEIVDAAGNAVVWNSINVRRGDRSTFTNSRSDLLNITSQDFDSIRVVMAWERFQPTADTYHASSFAALDQVLAYADDAGLEVILDPVHVAGGPDWGIPDWAWERSNEGEYDSLRVLDVLKENVWDYLAYVTARYHRDDRIAAIDLINEPREPVYDRLGVNNDRLMELYHDMVYTVRGIDDDKPLMLQPYYGSAKITTAQLRAVAAGTWVDPDPNPSDFTNLIWSLHDYYAGREGGAGADGYDRDGYGLRGRASDGTRYRTDSWDGTGCYPSGPAGNRCTWDTSRSDVLRPSMKNHVRAHLDVANAAGMAFYIGEFGIPAPAGRYLAWSGGDLYLADKVQVFDELGVSRALWAWSSEVDWTYGQYSMDNNNWRSWVPFAAGTQTVLETPFDGDVNCDGDVDTLFDAFASAQYMSGLRTARAGCPIAESEKAVFAPVADFDHDGVLETTDIEGMLRCVIGGC